MGKSGWQGGFADDFLTREAIDQALFHEIAGDAVKARFGPGQLDPAVMIRGPVLRDLAAAFHCVTL